jgi:hypothetical protein
MTVPLFSLACGGERPAATERSTAAPAKPAPAAEAVVRTGVMREIGPRVTDVAMLKRMPDGTYERTCGPPDPETRTMMEAVMRARMGSRR